MKNAELETSEQQVVSFFCRHLVAVEIEYCVPNVAAANVGKTVRKFYSATLIRIHGVLMLLTAGHILENIQNDIGKGCAISRARIHDTFGLEAEHKASIPYMINPEALHFIHDDKAGLDFGVIVIGQHYENLLHKNKMIALEERNWEHQHQVKFDRYAMLGLPEERCITNENGTVTVMPTFIPLNENASPPSDLNETHYERFFGTHSKLEDIKSLVGMSGGPIIGFRTDPEFQYWIIGIQSGWRPSENTVFATRIPVLAEIIKSEIEKAVA